MTNYFKELQSHSSKYHWFWQLFQGDVYSSFHTKTWHSQVWCIMLPKVWHFFLLNLFWNPNLCFPRTDSRAFLCHHTILLFKWNSLAFLRVQDNLAAAATGTQTYCTWAITPCDPARFCELREASPSSSRNKLTHLKKTIRLELPNCRFKPGHKTEDAFRASLYKFLLSAGRSRTAGHKTSYQVTTSMK